VNHELKTCRLCGESVKEVLRLEDTPIANSFPEVPNCGQKYPLNLNQCTSCGHVQIGFIVDDDVLYGAHYKYSTPDVLKSYLTERAITLRKEFPDAQNALEIGANNGLFLHALRDNGFPVVVGVDPSSKDPLVWKLPFGMDIVKLLERRCGRFDLIVANNVLAHISDLDDVFNAIYEMLSSYGTLVFENQYLIDMVGTSAFDMIYHEHKDYHSLRPLARFLKKHGMVMTKYERVDLHNGSIRVYASKHGVECELPPENPDFRKFAKNIARIKQSMNIAIGNEKVVCFGATAKACTLIHHCGIADKIEYCVDSTKEKQGKYIPGTAIQIKPETELEQHKKVLVTAWNYAGYIKSKYPNTRMIVPFVQLNKAA